MKLSHNIKAPGRKEGFRKCTVVKLIKEMARRLGSIRVGS